MAKPLEMKIAEVLGVTPTGLRQLAKGYARDNGEVGGGMATIKLESQGYAAPAEPERRAASAYTPSIITEAGREIVRRARAMGF